MNVPAEVKADDLARMVELGFDTFDAWPREDEEAAVGASARDRLASEGSSAADPQTSLAHARVLPGVPTRPEPIEKTRPDPSRRYACRDRPESIHSAASADPAGVEPIAEQRRYALHGHAFLLDESRSRR